jgi:hypothetical protein
LEQAAMVAAGRFGLENADSLLDRALQLRRQLPAERVDVGAELAVISRLAAVRRARYGYDSATQQVPMDHAKELARTGDASAAFIDLLWMEWAAAATSGEISTAHRLATELAAAARNTSDPQVIAAAASSWGIQCWHEGRIGEAVTAMDRAALNYEAAAAISGPYDSTNPLMDHWTLGAGFHEMMRQMAGLPRDDDAVVDPGAGAAPHVRVTRTLSFAMAISFSGDFVEALRLTEIALEVGADQVFGFFVPAVHCVHASALIALGQAAAGVAELGPAIEEYLAAGARTVIPYYLSRLALGRLVLGDVDGAAADLARAAAVLAATGELWNEPYLLATGAALAAARGAPAAEARAQRDAAVALATAMGAHGIAARLPLELRELGLDLGA